MASDQSSFQVCRERASISNSAAEALINGGIDAENQPDCTKMVMMWYLGTLAEVYDCLDLIATGQINSGINGLTVRSISTLGDG